VNASSTGRPNESGWYEIRFRGRLDPRWSTWFDGMTLSPGADGSTILQGPVVDQAALHGLLTRIRDIGLPLISVAQVDPDPAKHPSAIPDSNPVDPNNPNSLGD